VNAITIDQCKKTGVVFEEVVSLVEVISCARTDIQCTNRLSTITVDKSDECKVFPVLIGYSARASLVIHT